MREEDSMANKSRRGRLAGATWGLVPAASAESLLVHAKHGLVAQLLALQGAELAEIDSSKQPAW